MNVGDYVVDTEDDDPDLAVVIHRPNVAIESATVGGDDETRTVAEDNPAYEPTEPAVRVAFVESGLDTKWQEWTDVPPARLYEGAQDNGVKIYTFPQSRLSVLTEEQAENIRADTAVDMEGLRTRLDEADWDVESTNDGSLISKKMGEEYRITPTGDVEGSGDIREPLENLVATYTE